MQSRNVIERIKALKKKPQFNTGELEQILQEYAPNFPQAMDYNEFFHTCTALFNFGYIRGRGYQARKHREKTAI